MKRSIFFISVFLLGLLSQVLAATPQNKQVLWTYLSKMQTYNADFKQTTRDAKGRVTQQSHGRMALLRPGYLKWETIEPTHQLLFVNKNTVWIYDVDLEQASKNTLSTDDNNSGALLSSSATQMKRQFAVDSVKTQHGMSCFVLHKKQTPADEEMTNDQITLCFKNSVLESMSLAHSFGDQTQFVFSNIQMNQTISLSTFHFTPPDGVEIIDQKKM